MTSVIKYCEGINPVDVIGNHLPRQCGIATFTSDLVEGLSAEAPDMNCWAVVMNDKPEGWPYSGYGAIRDRSEQVERLPHRCSISQHQSDGYRLRAA